MNGGPPRGRVLVVGPDGSGKSTLVGNIVERVAAVGVPAVRAHWRPGLVLPHHREHDGPVREPHDLPPRGTISTVVRLALFTLDQMVGLLGPWRRASRRGLLIVERGWLDMAVDPRRYRLPAWATRTVERIGHMLPEADLAVLLSGDPAILDERTGEIGATEIARQLERWRELLPDTARNVLEIDTTTNDRSAVTERTWAAITERSGGP